MYARRKREILANRAMYKAAANNICTVLKRAVPGEDKPNAVHTNRYFYGGLFNGALHNNNVACVARAAARQARRRRGRGRAGAESRAAGRTPRCTS